MTIGSNGKSWWSLVRLRGSTRDPNGIRRRRERFAGVEESRIGVAGLSRKCSVVLSQQL